MMLSVLLDNMYSGKFGKKEMYIYVMSELYGRPIEQVHLLFVNKKSNTNVL